MKLPRCLIVFGEKYALKRISGLMKAGAMGLCTPGKKLIAVDASLKGEDLQITLIHEIAHAAIHEVGAESLISDDLNEIISDAVARAVAKNFTLRSKAVKK